MKKTMLWGALFALTCTYVQADMTQQPTQITATGVNPPAQVPVVIQPNTNVQTAPGSPTQPSQPTAPAPTINPAPQNIHPNPPAPQSMQQAPMVQPAAALVINCDYKIPAETKTVESSLVLNWSEKAITQAFNFDPASVDTQVQKLKACFTEQGWQGFNTALQKSGNVEAIKSQKLTVSSLMDGQPQLKESKDNQWKITLPLQVVYQNDKEKVTQLLNVDLTVSRKINGDLGIVQMIATPRPPVTAVQQTPPPTTTTAPTTPVNSGIAPNPAPDQPKPVTGATPPTPPPATPH